jgi:tetratricopeptide (TPR) repeat protein
MTMTPSSREDQKKEAFRLFEDGQYQESLRVCNLVLEEEKDPAVEVLAATNLYTTGRLEDAEVFFRDLVHRMPGSSYVHSYLAKVLEARGDDGAIAEYATAVHLDPTNQDALRSYAEYLLARQDFRSALPVFRLLARLTKKSGDVRNLMRALIETGRADEAVATHTHHGADTGKTPEYVDALAGTGNHHAAADAAHRIWCETRDPAMLRKYLEALSRYDLPGSLAAYEAHLQGDPDSMILSDYALLLDANGENRQALRVAGALISRDKSPMHRLLECDLLAAGDEAGKARDAYERLIREELGTKNDMDFLALEAGRYRRFLLATLPADQALHRFLDVVSRDVNVVSLLETARMYATLGNPAEARAWYYRAYRADFLNGGPEYAIFLALQGENRECEKVMLYVLSNARKSADLTRIASVIVDEKAGMRQLRRLLDQLIHRLDEHRETLGSAGLELLAIAFFLAAANTLEEADYAGCKYYCLCGMDVLPAQTRAIHLEDYLRIIRDCKERSIADRPVMREQPLHHRQAPIPTEKAISDQLGLTQEEEKIVAFLRSHRKASEMELRKLLGTRRVVGIVNRLVQKAASQGLSVLEKKGFGEDGEVYEYTGT